MKYVVQAHFHKLELGRVIGAPQASLRRLMRSRAPALNVQKARTAMARVPFNALHALSESPQVIVAQIQAKTADIFALQANFRQRAWSLAKSVPKIRHRVESAQRIVIPASKAVSQQEKEPDSPTSIRGFAWTPPICSS